MLAPPRSGITSHTGIILVALQKIRTSHTHTHTHIDDKSHSVCVAVVHIDRINGRSRTISLYPVAQICDACEHNDIQFLALALNPIVGKFKHHDVSKLTIPPGAD